MKKFFYVLFFFVFINLYSFDVNEIKEYFKNYDKKYLIYISKQQKKLFLINSEYKIIKTYIVATGFKEGIKLYEGDEKTPEGEYKIIEIWSYKKPKNLIEKEKNLMQRKLNDNEIKKIKKIIDEYEYGKKQLKRINSVYLSAKDGHKKFKSEEDLGYNSYGPVFLRINYPNKEDKKRYEEAIKNKIIPKNKKIGSGIAIHGTNDEASLGHNASSGCIRMNNNDIEELLEYIEKDTKVIIKY